MARFSVTTARYSTGGIVCGLALGLGVILTVLAATPAAARPRDTVLSNAFRCAVIGDSRTWLDCYYGAAQTARAALGLPSASAYQERLVAQPPTGTPPADDLAVRDAVMNGAVRCSSLGDAQQWLSCYYAAARPMRVHLGLESGPAVQAPPPIQTTPDLQAASDFGKKPGPMFPSGNGPHVSSPMRAYAFSKFGWFTVTLQNGQVWQQVQGDTNVAHWRGPAKSYMVRVSQGALGSYNLRVENQPGIFKVRRTR